MKIIIVEDEIRIREGIANLLKKSGQEYEVLGEASDGVEGVALCLEKNPDLIITDIKMPRMDGIEMLGKIYESGLKTKAIVLSAYSEFEYARGAMKLGVTEYLLKPISLMDFTNALNNIKIQLEEEELKKPKNIGTLEQTINDIFYGSIQLDDEIAGFLKHTYNVDAKKEMWIACACLGKKYEGLAKYKRMFFDMLREKEDIEFSIIESPFRKSLIAVVYTFKDVANVEHWLQYRILLKDMQGITFGCAKATDLSKVKETYDCLAQFMDWNVSFEKDILISYPQITNIQTAICSYPMEAEKSLRTALGNQDYDKVKKAFLKFHESFTDGKIYSPREIKDCYVRFLWFAMETARDLGNAKVRQIERQDLLRSIMESYSKTELREISDEVVESICFANEIKEDVNDLTVKRAKNIIHDYYNTGITLDEIASKLNITPEYLGTKFKNETGITFSTYMKEYRITKAKELLLGSNMKLYEISDMVGYNDPKYFSRVFKEETGMLPAEYRKTK